jgi:hypothetical protein
MGKYPVTVAAQGLYEVSTVQRHELGTTHVFDTTLGPVWARYVKNNNAAAILEGYAVAQAAVLTDSPYAVNTFANVSFARAPGMVAGVMCASMQGTATSLGGGGYAWCAYQGPITNAHFAASYDSNVFSYVTVNSASLLAVVATSQGSVVSVLGPSAIIGQLGATASTITRASAGTGGSAGSYLFLLWK